MQTHTSKPGYRFAIAVVGALLLATWALAVGPSNQVVPNPAPGGANTLSSVVGVVEVSGGNITANGTGTVFDSFIFGTNCFLCVLTADHNFPDANRIVFPNYTLGGAAPAAGTHPIIAHQQVAGLNAMQNVDAAVALVRYGPLDGFFLAVPDKSLTTAVGTGDVLSLIGFGRGGDPVFDLMTGNLTGVNQGNQASAGTKRYMNNRLTAFVPNHVDAPYTYNAIKYTFDAQGEANFIFGEGGTFAGDSGAPLFNKHLDFDPGGGLPLILSVDDIAGVHTLGTAAYVNGTEMFGVDVFDYRNNIMTACSNLIATVPEPAVVVLLAFGGFVLMMLCRRR